MLGCNTKFISKLYRIIFRAELTVAQDIQVNKFHHSVQPQMKLV